MPMLLSMLCLCFLLEIKDSWFLIPAWESHFWHQCEEFGSGTMMFIGPGHMGGYVNRYSFSAEYVFVLGRLDWWLVYYVFVHVNYTNQ